MWGGLHASSGPVTPYQKAQAILDELVNRATSVEPEPLDLPSVRYAQIGAPQTVTCESLIVGASSITADGADDLETIACDAVQLGTFVLIWAIDCAFVANEDGTDDPVRVAQASERMDAAGNFLWSYANELDPFLSKEWTMTFALAGGLGITTLTLITGID